MSCIDRRLVIRVHSDFVHNFRLFVLLPIRVSLCIVALQWVTGVALLSLVVKYTKRQRLYICVVFARLTNASMGLVAKYVDRQNRPKPPG